MKSTLVEHKMSVSIEFSIWLLVVGSIYAGEADSNSYCVLSRLKLVLCVLHSNMAYWHQQHQTSEKQNSKAKYTHLLLKCHSSDIIDCCYYQIVKLLISYINY